MKYKNLFFDLDDTLWACSENSRETFHEMYEKYRLNKFFESFDQYYKTYEDRNAELWNDYVNNKITREQLNDLRFSHPFEAAGVYDESLAYTFRDDYFDTIHTKGRLMPYAKEILDYLKEKNYNLFIISNGFRELQHKKMEAGGIDKYFHKVILSDDIGVAKPNILIFHFALSATQSQASDSIIIGDNWNTDITGAKNAGIDQVFYDWNNNWEMTFKPTYLISSLEELKGIF